MYIVLRREILIGVYRIAVSVGVNHRLGVVGTERINNLKLKMLASGELCP